MNEKMENYALRTRPAPEPKDRDRELAVLHLLLDVIEQSSSDLQLEKLCQLHELTPWIASQLGCIVEAGFYGDNVERELSLAKLAIHAALESRSQDLYFANTLTMANLFLRYGATDMAKEVYYKILRLPLDFGEDERVCAHFTLMQMSLAPAEKAFHYEMGLRARGGILEDNVRQEFARHLTPSYRELQDLAGLVHVCQVLGIGNPAEILEIRNEEHSIGSIMNLCTRLTQFGHANVAREIQDNWKKFKEK